MKRLLVLACLLLLPTAAAHDEVGAFDAPDGAQVNVLDYRLASINEHEELPPPGEVINRTYDATKIHNYDVLQHDLILTVEASAEYVAESEGVWDLTFYQDGKILPGCTGHIVTSDLGGFLAGDFSDKNSRTIHCVRAGTDALNDIIHNHTITAILSIGSGTPADLTHLDISVNVIRQDRVIMSQPTTFELVTGLSALEFLVLPLLAILGLFLWSRNDVGVRLLGTLLLLVDSGMAGALAFTIRGGAYGILLPMAILFLAAGIYTFVKWVMQLTGYSPTPGRGN